MLVMKTHFLTFSLTVCTEVLLFLTFHPSKDIKAAVCDFNKDPDALV